MIQLQYSEENRIGDLGLSICPFALLAILALIKAIMHGIQLQLKE